MKKLLILFLIYEVASVVDRSQEKKEGPAYNIKNSGQKQSCTDRYVISNDTEWLEDSGTSFVPSGVSDCVDLLLYDQKKEKYYDHCCYVRFQLKGKMHAGCIGLSEENYLDTSVTMKRMEEGDRDIWTREAANSKVYQLDCFSSFLKSLPIASILLLALFF